MRQPMWMSVAAVVVGLGAVGGAHAETAHRLYHQNTDNVRLIRRDVVEPAATVSPELADQPVHPHLVELKVVHVSTYIDPSIDYVRKNGAGHGLSESHSIVKAQRMHASMDDASALPTRVILGNGHQPRAAAGVPQPLMIITKPKLGPQTPPQEQNKDQQKIARLD